MDRDDSTMDSGCCSFFVIGEGDDHSGGADPEEEEAAMVEAKPMEAMAGARGCLAREDHIDGVDQGRGGRREGRREGDHTEAQADNGTEVAEAEAVQPEATNQ